jgi:hypothetical protein
LYFVERPGANKALKARGKKDLGVDPFHPFSLILSTPLPFSPSTL